jgi:hypothetical protein
VAALSLLVGCGPSGPHTVKVYGKVTYQGKPVTQGRVTFTPIREVNIDDPSLYRPAVAMLKADGSYVLQTFREKDGVMPGEYAVAIIAFHEWRPPKFPGDHAEYSIPEKYVKSETSGLTVTVPEDASGSIEQNFNLVD